MWFLFQGLIVFAVVATNIHWHWTPNGYIPALLGGALACAFTWLLSVLQARSWLASTARQGRESVHRSVK